MFFDYHSKNHFIFALDPRDIKTKKKIHSAIGFSFVEKF